MVDMKMPKGFGFIAGRGQDRARQVLEATEAADLDPQSILTRGGGYLAPLAVVEAVAAADDEGARTEAPENETEVGEQNVTGEKVEGDGAGEDPAIVEVNGQQVGDGSEIVELTDGEKPAEGEAGQDDATKLAEEAEEQKPAGNASTEAWSEWAAKYKGYDEAEKLSRADIIQRYDA